MHRAIAIAALASLLDGSARADVVPPEPTNCPPGSVGRTCHGGAYCGVAEPCTSSSCASETTCQLAQLCVTQLDCDGKGGPYYVDSVKGTCAGGTCSVGACKTVQACLPAAPRPDARMPQPDAKTPQLDAKTPQPDARSSTDAATGSSRRGCTCGLEPAVATDVPLGSLFAVAIVLCWRGRRSRG